MKDPKDTKDIAVALRYDGNNTPTVTAKGANETAALIRQIAKEHDIPVYYEPLLAQVLTQIDLGEEIPEALYRAVAQVIVFAYIMSGKIQAIPEYLPRKPESDA